MSSINNSSLAKTLVVSAQLPKKLPRVRRTVLVVASGDQQGREYAVDKDVFVIGKGDSVDLKLDDPATSRRHCEIRADEHGYSIVDLNSTNGTFVNGVRISNAYLNPGAELQFGNIRLVFSPLQEDRELQISPAENFGSVVGSSQSMRRIFYMAETYAATNASIMLTGETGTGKEIMAEEIHRHSLRSDKPFVIIDCAALAKDLIESELFGHVKGAFTGAAADRPGAFEYANGGTVFLDEVGDLSMELQPKLLRVLEKREIRRVGTNAVRKIDVRIICATNRDMHKEVEEGRFREDLFYRLAVVNIELPPLRKRKEDIPLLARRFASDLHGPDALDEIAEFDASMEVLRRYDWPGNVRELRNLIDRAFYGPYRPVDLSASMSFWHRGGTQSGPSSGKLGRGEVIGSRPFKEEKAELVDEFERKYIMKLLKRNDGNISKSAREADIERAYLQRLIKKYSINVGE
jgi:transcriptional regulator with GAF, ATPase, and Fis domain